MGGGCSKSSKEEIRSTGQTPKQEGKKLDVLQENVEEFKIPKVELSENEMKVVQVDGEAEVLLVKSNGQLHAVGAKCPHYGAPLVKGTVCNGKVRCPWHGACFALETGDIEEFPSVDGIPTFHLEEKTDHFLIKGSIAAMKAKGFVKPLSKLEKNSESIVVIVGGGGAGFTCANTLRKEGFTGKVILITKEPHLPYDRPKLSKALSVKAEEIALKPEEYFKNADIEVMRSVEVVQVNISEKLVKLSNGDTQNYTNLVLAVGGSPRKITFPGSDLENVFYLRSPEDANRIAAESKGKNVVIAGASFIGMESAACLVKDAASLTVVEWAATPFKRVLGEEIGMRLKALHEEHGVKFKLETTISECTGEGGKIKEVKLSDGTILEADVLLLGLGVVPATGFLKDSGLEMDPAGNIVVNEFMQSSDSSVYAAGDIANFPLALHSDSPPIRTTIGHWSLAMAHGRTAALNIMGKKRPMSTVPFFWTQMFGKSIRYAGHASSFDQIIIRGSFADLKFAAYFCLGDRVSAVATLMADPIAAAFADLLSEKKVLTKEEVLSLPSALE